MIELRPIVVEVPAAVAQALALQRLKYCDIDTACAVYQYVEVDECVFVGVVGDAGNCAYEWFIWHDAFRSVEVSDSGFGSCVAALRAGLWEFLASIEI
jgi:hypothetical protein